MRTVRHIHAKPNQYVAVHRKHGTSNRATSSDDNAGMGGIVIALIGFWLFYCYWKIIVVLLLSAVAIWLLWAFRKELGRFISKAWTFFTRIFRGSKKPDITLVSKNTVPTAVNTQSLMHNTASSSPSPTICADEPAPNTYGKIIQGR